jgi:IS5 family transposase
MKRRSNRVEGAVAHGVRPRGGLAQFGFAKVRYRGLAKNAKRAFVVLGLVDIYLARGLLAG